jgi:adenylate cyclase
MITKGVKRKLTAILSADVKGYSRLMGEDEVATVQTLTSYREVMANLIQQHWGRVVDSPGDNLLAEFSSVVDAVQCAVEIQKDLNARNVELPENRRMEFRIGINLGDVIEDGERIYGDGVNIAARVEGLGEGGGIFISGTAYDQIEGKLALRYEYLGEHTVKNIKKPVRVYRVPIGPGTGAIRGSDGTAEKPRTWQWVALVVGAALVLITGGALVWNFYLRSGQLPSDVSSEQAQALKPPDKPSIAVLPFVNMSGDPQQEYFSDGITENIITGLSKIPRLMVIARNSSFTYKGVPVKIQQLGQDLGVRYVLEGSVQKSEDKVRITAQLIDATTGQHLWAERYDRNLNDIFALQDEITMKIITALQVKLTVGERARVLAKGTDNLEAYLKLLQGLEFFHSRSPGERDRAREIAEEVIALAPEYPKGYALLARTHLRDVKRNKSKSPSESLERAFELAQKVLNMDDSDIDGHIALGNVYLLRNQHEMAVSELEKAVALNPNSTEAIDALGRMLIWTGRPEEALELFKRAIRLDPLHAQMSYIYLGRTYRIMGQYEEAISVFKKVTREEPDRLNPRLELIACYTALGRSREANAEVAEVLRIKPNFSIEEFSKMMPYRDPVNKAHYLDLLRKGGLPD